MKLGVIEGIDSWIEQSDAKRKFILLYYGKEG
jgi:hypothetical protein